MESEIKRKTYFFVITNTILTFSLSVLQFLHYFLSEYATENVKKTSLAFLVLRPILHVLLVTIYLIIHTEVNLKCMRKFCLFWLHIGSIYTGYTPGVHMSFYSKFYLESENGMVIAKIVNAYTFILVALPLMLIVSINSSALDKWLALDIITLTLSCLYVIWCIVYYISCSMDEFSFELDLEDLARLNVVDSNNI